MGKNLVLVLFMQFFIFLGCKNRLFEKNKIRSSQDSFEVNNSSNNWNNKPWANHEGGMMAFYHERVVKLLNKITLCANPNDTNCPFKNPKMKMLRLIDPQNSVSVIEGYTWKNFFLNLGPDQVKQKLKCFNNNLNLTIYMDRAKNNLMEPNELLKLKPQDCHNTWDQYNSMSFWKSNIYELRRRTGFQNIGLYENEALARDLLTFPIVRVDFPNYDYMKFMKAHNEDNIMRLFGTYPKLDELHGPNGLEKRHLGGDEYVGKGGMSSNYYVVIHKTKFTEEDLKRIMASGEAPKLKLALKQLSPLYREYVLMPLDTAFKRGFKGVGNIGPLPFWAKGLQRHKKRSFMEFVRNVESDAYDATTDINKCNQGQCNRTYGRYKMKAWCKKNKKKCRIQTVKIESKINNNLWRCEQNSRFMDLHTKKSKDANGGDNNNIFHIVTDIDATDKLFPYLNHNEHPRPPRSEVVYIYHEQNLAFLQLHDNRFRCNIKEHKVFSQNETRFIKEPVGNNKTVFRFKNMSNNKYIHGTPKGIGRTYHWFDGKSDSNDEHTIHPVGNHTDWTRDIVWITYDDLVKFLGYNRPEGFTYKHDGTNYTFKNVNNISITQVSNIHVNTGTLGTSIHQSSPVLIEDECYFEPDLDYKVGGMPLKQIFNLESDTEFERAINANIDVKKIFKLNCDTRPERAASYIAEKDFKMWSDKAKRQLAAQIGIRFAENILLFEAGSFVAEKLFADWIVGIAKAMIFVDSLKMIPNFFADLVDYRICVSNNLTEIPCFAIMEESVLNMAFMAVAYHKAKSNAINQDRLMSDTKNELLKFTNEVISDEKDFGKSNRMKETFNKFTIKGIKDKIESFFEDTNCKIN